MANPLQPKIIKCLEEEYNAFVVNIVSTSKSGTMDLLACVPTNLEIRGNDICVVHVLNAYSKYLLGNSVGVFYGFEVKWGKDVPSELQKQKINDCIRSGGKAYFIRSVEELRNVLDNNIEPTIYETKKKFTI